MMPAYVAYLVPVAIGAGAALVAAFFMRKDFDWKDAAIGLLFAGGAVAFQSQAVNRLEILAWVFMAALIAVAALIPRPRLSRDWYVDPNTGEHFRVTGRHNGTLVTEQRTSRERFLQWHESVKVHRFTLAFFAICPLIGLALKRTNLDGLGLLFTAVGGFGTFIAPWFALLYAFRLWNRTDFAPVWPAKPEPRTDIPQQQTQTRQQRRKKLS